MKYNFKDVKDNFEPIPTDRYAVEIVKMEEAKSAQKGTPMLKVQYKIIDGPMKGRIVFDNFVLQANALFKLKQLMAAASSKLLNADWDEQDVINDLVGKKISVYVETTYSDEYQKNQSSCSHYTALSGVSQAPAAKQTNAFE